MHLGGLLGVPVVAIFGPQNPSWFGPRGPQDRVVIRPEFWCRPCFDYCIFDEPYCLRLVTVAEVCSEVSAALEDLRALASAEGGADPKANSFEGAHLTVGTELACSALGTLPAAEFAISVREPEKPRLRATGEQP